MKNIITKNILNIKILSLFGAFAAVISSCVDDSATDITPKDAVLNVVEGEYSLLEDQEQVTIEVKFNKSALASGQAIVDLTTVDGIVYGTDYTTVPDGSSGSATIEIAAGDNSASIAVLPIMQAGINDTKSISLSFNGNGAVDFGAQNSAEVVILNKPEIHVTGTLSDFGSVLELENSVSQNFVLSGEGLTDAMTVKAPINFQISIDDADFTDEITFKATDIEAKDTTIYVRFSPEFDALAAQSGNIEITSQDADDQVIATAGTGTAQPATVFLTTTSIPSFGVAVNGTSTTSKSFDISGYRLTENIVVTAPAQFEVSLNDVAFASSVDVDFSTINMREVVTVYTRFSPNSGVLGGKAGNITITTTGVADGSISVEGEEGFPLVAWTSFEEPAGEDVDYTDTGDPNVDRALINNAGEAPVQYTSIGGELGFQTLYISTGSVGATDGDDFGVTTKSSIVGDSPQGGYTDGVQGYVMDDTDGIMRIVLDEIETTGLTTLNVSIDYLFNDTGWEGSDYITVTAESSLGTQQVIVTLDGDDIDDGGLDPEPHIWHSSSADISSLLGQGAVQLTIEVVSNSGAEEVYFDNIQFRGI